MAYSFTKSRNSILLAKYVTGFCTSRSTGRGGAETVRAAFHSHAAPLPSCTLPPLAHPPSFPAPGNTLDPSASFSHPRSARAQHPSPRLRLTLRAHPSCLRRLIPRLHRPRSVPPPLTRGAPARGPVRAARPRRVPPSVRPSHCAHPHPPCASGMRAKGVEGVRVWWGTGDRCSLGGGDCPRMRGVETLSLVPPWHVGKGEGGGGGWQSPGGGANGRGG